MQVTAKSIRNYEEAKVQRIKNVVVWLSVVLIAGLLFGYSGIEINCPIYKLTNIKCPFCGATRACRSILNGNLKDAFQFNQLLVIAIPFIGIYILYQCKYYIDTSKFKSLRPVINLAIVMGVLFFIWRNFIT